MGLMVPADFNGDGFPDLAIVNLDDSNVTIFLGNAKGTFTQAPGSPIGGNFSPSAIAAGDFNGDGIPDMAAANQLGDTLTVLLGNGDGTFTSAAKSPVAVGSDPVYAVAADFNGDGKPDLAVLNQCGSDASCSSPGNVTILLGSGTGTFSQSASSPVAVASSPNFVVVGDFNGDGISDLAAANNGVGTVSVDLTQLSQSAKATATGINPTGTGTHNVEAKCPGDTIHKASVSTTTPLL
jgi:hypothetical protein